MGQRYESAWDNGLRNLGGHWIKEGSRSKSDTLDSLMQPDHVILVHEDGTVSDKGLGVYAPEVNVDTDGDGQILAEHETAMVDSLRSEGWEPEGGWSGQQGTKADDVIMHVSEFIGGRLAEHILSTPGYWVACAVDVDSLDCPEGVKGCTLDDRCEHCEDNGREREPAGWVVMHKEIPEGGK